MTSTERTAYPQFKRLTSARVLHVFFTPSEDDAAWARERTETPESLLALLVDLKCFLRLHRGLVRKRQGATRDPRRARRWRRPRSARRRRQLRARITAATNKVESYNGFSHWLAFGNNGVLADNDPDEQEKLIKLNTLLANLVIFHNALDIMDVVRKLAAEGWLITADQLGAMSPYLRGHISRFGAYATDDLARQPEAFNPVLKEVDFTALGLAA